MLTFDTRALERTALRLGGAADQVRFAAARALNDSVEKARDTIVNETWPSAVKVRNARFLGAALTTAGRKATKANLRAELYDKLGRAHLSLHETGGTKSASGRLALPNRTVVARIGARGVPGSLRPANLKNAFRKGDVIYQRVGKYQKGTKRRQGVDARRLKLMYTLKASAPIKPSVPFHPVFARVVKQEMTGAFARRVAEAMRTRR